jgi:hypothetical protein
MDEQARKRKLSEIGYSDVEGIEREKPKEGLKAAGNDKKKRKIDTTQATTPSKSESVAKVGVEDDGNDAARRAKAEQKNLKQQRKKDKIVKRLEKQKAKKEKVAEQKIDVGEDENEINVDSIGDLMDEGHETVPTRENSTSAKELGNISLHGIQEEVDGQQSPGSPSSEPPSPIFDNTTGQSANTSTSSVVPPATAPKHIKLPTDPELLKARLAARIEALRALRKADGPNGAPARNRQELMEARRKKEEQRRAHKKELRLKAKAEEEARREEALASARDSPASSMLSPAIHNSSSENNFSFNRVSFSDGATLATDLSSLHSAPRPKGPRDPATALLASEKKRLRLIDLDDAKRADIEEKDLWLSAKKRAHGEKVRDDTSLLKKTLKRKEKAKKKSEKEWAERKEGVAKGQAVRQKKREENLRKRREEKGGKGGRGKGGKSSGRKGKPKVKSRPGFEGSFSSGGKRR